MPASAPSSIVRLTKPGPETSAVAQTSSRTARSSTAWAISRGGRPSRRASANAASDWKSARGERRTTGSTGPPATAANAGVSRSVSSLSRSMGTPICSDPSTQRISGTGEPADGPRTAAVTGGSIRRSQGMGQRGRATDRRRRSAPTWTSYDVPGCWAGALVMPPTVAGRPRAGTPGSPRRPGWPRAPLPTPCWPYAGSGQPRPGWRGPVGPDVLAERKPTVRVGPDGDPSGKRVRPSGSVRPACLGGTRSSG